MVMDMFKGVKLNMFRGSTNILLNDLGQKITLLTINENEDIKEGDFVVVNTRTLSAHKPKGESGYFPVGRAIVVFNDGHYKRVLCKDGIYLIKNTDQARHRIARSEIGRMCYFENAETVTLDNINTTKAGRIVNVCGDEECGEKSDEYVVVSMKIDERSEFE